MTVNRDRQRALLDKLWSENPSRIREFQRQFPAYQTVAREVEYVLRKRISERSIEVAGVTSRAKTLTSFVEKLARKNYDDPWHDVTDFAGARVVCLFRSDVDRIEDEIIRAEFEQLERVDTVERLGPGEFGYTARHYIVTLGSEMMGARYDHLKGLKCEIQVRTAMQDAWAVMNHHLLYKYDGNVPAKFQDKVAQIKAFVDNGDESFEQLLGDVTRHLRATNLDVQLDEESLHRHLRNRLRHLRVRIDEELHKRGAGGVDAVVRTLRECGYVRLGDVDRALARFEAVGSIDELQARWPNMTIAQIVLSIAAAMDPAVATHASVPTEWIDRVKSVGVVGGQDRGGGDHEVR